MIPSLEPQPESLVGTANTGLPVVTLTPLLLVGIKHSSEVTSFMFSWPNCWRGWLHYTLSWKGFFSDSWESIKIVLKKNSWVMNCLIYPSILSKGTESQRIEKTSTENGFLVSLEALYFIEFVSELLFFISPFYFFSGMHLPFSVQPLSHVWLFVTPFTAALRASLSITNSQSLLKLMSVQSVMLSNHLILCRPLLLLPSVFPSIGVFPNESALRIRWPKYWSFSFSISPSNEYSRLISFRIDWLDLLAVHEVSRVFSNTTVQKHYSSVLSFLYSPTLTSINDYWKNHSFDWMNLCPHLCPSS